MMDAMIVNLPVQVDLSSTGLSVKSTQIKVDFTSTPSRAFDNVSTSDAT